MLQETITYQVKGMNFKKFLTTLKKEDFIVCKLQRKEFNLFLITIKKSQEKIFLQLTKKFNYETNIIEQTPTLIIKNNFKKHFAFTLSIIFIFLSLAFCSNIVFKFEIYGCNSLSQEEIISVLNKNNINVYNFKSSYNLSSIESLLKQNLNKVSLASAIIKGNTLIINIDEKIDNDEYIYNYQPILAPYDCIIKEVALKSGTLVVEEGQTIKKGEVIVAPYIDYKDGTQLAVEARAEIQAYIEISNTIEYLENHTEFVRSGKFVIKETFSLYNLNLGQNFQKTKFANYETEVIKSYPFKNFILPLIKTKTIYYELVEKQTFVPFEKVKQNLIEQNKKILYNGLSNPFKNNLECFTTINYDSNIYFVTTYLKGVSTFS